MPAAPDRPAGDRDPVAQRPAPQSQVADRDPVAERPAPQSQVADRGRVAERPALQGRLPEPDLETGSWFPVPDESALADSLRGLFAKVRARLGFVPNVFRVYAFRPQRLSAWFAHYRQLHEPTPGLDAADRELVAVVVSQANGCLYCLVAHGAALRAELGDPVLGERISYDWRRAGLDPRREAICAYAEKLTLRPREVTREDLRSLLDAGLSVEEAWDVAELASMYNLTNRMAMATNMLPNEQYSGEARP
jgi:uncharacterized peroxidase-related enzyme